MISHLIIIYKKKGTAFMEQLNREKAFLIIKMKDYAYNLDQFRDYLIKSLNPIESKAYYNLTERSPVAHQTVFNQMKDCIFKSI